MRVSLRFSALTLESLDLLLLLLNHIEHSPDNRVVIEYQVAVTVLSHCFGWLIQNSLSKMVTFCANHLT